MFTTRTGQKTNLCRLSNLFLPSYICCKTVPKFSITSGSRRKKIYIFVRLDCAVETAGYIPCWNFQFRSSNWQMGYYMWCFWMHKTPNMCWDACLLYKNNNQFFLATFCVIDTSSVVRLSKNLCLCQRMCVVIQTQMY